MIRKGKGRRRNTDKTRQLITISGKKTDKAMV